MRHAPTLLVMSPSTGGYYFGALLTGIAREVAACGGHVVLVQTLEPGQHSDEIGEAPDFSLPVGWHQADGVIAVSSAVRPGYLRLLQEAGVPLVVMSNQFDDLQAPAASPDNHGGITLAVEHLLSHGHRSIGFVGNTAQRDVRDRHEAYRKALTAAGLTPDPAHLFIASDNAEHGGSGVAPDLLACADRPTALVTATDRNAIGLIRSLADGGIDVPAELAVVSFDNIEAAPYTSPPLTTVDQPFDEVGALAASLVLARAGGADVPDELHVAPAELVVRGSCGCPSADPTGRAQAAATSAKGHVVQGARRSTERRLVRMLSTGDAAHDAHRREEIAAVTRGAEALSMGTSQAVGVIELVDRIRALSPRPSTTQKVARTLVEHLEGSGRTPGGPLAAALRDLQAGAFLARSSEVECRLDEQFGLDAGLLDAVGSDPCDLTWLRGTHVTGGVLAVWVDGVDGPLDVVGTHDATGATPTLKNLVGTRTTAEEFPPRELVESVSPADRRLCVVVPVRSRGTERGLLAVTAEIDTASAQETYHHWAALLASALEQSALQRAVHASERRYALASHAANDGLWEIDLVRETAHFSDRCQDLLGAVAGIDGIDALTDLAHPEDAAALRERIAAATSLLGTPVELEYRLRRPDGTYRWVLTRFLGDGPPGGPVERLVGSLSDIHTRKELEEQLRQGALYDAVTGLPNRRLFLDRLEVALRQRDRGAGGFAVVFLDLDGFKLVNDSLGHLRGDELLVVVAHRLRACLRSVDTAARFGGDEFAVLLADPVAEEVLAIVERIQQRIAAPVALGEQEVQVTASVGITTCEVGYTSAEDVLRDADIAMYHAKATERGTASVFDPEMHVRATGRLRTRAELRTALAREQFAVHYQPIVALDGSGLGHFEALIRWEHPTRGLLGPGEFLPAMEEDGSVVALGRWVIEEVCRQVACWRAVHSGAVTVSVNLSHREFWAPDLARTVQDALLTHDVPAHCLVLEITETVIMTDSARAVQVMEDLHALGVRLHVDDFGTGHSSLNTLRTLPVDALKIDGSFIREITETERTADLVEIILHLARVLGLDVIAECVETPAQADHLLSMGCANAQGWLYAKALPGHEAGALLGLRLASPAVDSAVGSELS